MKPCSHCGERPRATSHAWCLECRREYRRLWNTGCSNKFALPREKKDPPRRRIDPDAKYLARLAATGKMFALLGLLYAGGAAAGPVKNVILACPLQSGSLCAFSVASGNAGSLVGMITIDGAAPFQSVSLTGPDAALFALANNNTELHIGRADLVQARPYIVNISVSK